MKDKAQFFVAALTFSILWILSRYAIWNNHLQIDVWVSWERLNYWFNHAHSFKGLIGNELLPATLMYVFIPVWMIPANFLSYANYLPSVMLINLLILIAHYLIVKNKNILLICLLFLGPILLFRFDGLVTLTMLLAFMSFEKGSYKKSGFWMGIATGMKVFPVIVIPYFAIILLSQKKFRKLASFIVAFGESLMIPVVVFYSMGGSISQILAALAFHSQKLISIESIPGSFITLVSLITNGHPPAIIPGNGIWAVGGPAMIFNKLWMVPVGMLYVFILTRKRLQKVFKPIVPYTLLLVFLVFSKNLNPQYLWWFMAILPLLKPGKWMIGLTLVAALSNQLVFPIFYTTYVESFFRNGNDHWIFYILLLRNISIIGIALMSLRQLWKEAHEQ